MPGASQVGERPVPDGLLRDPKGPGQRTQGRFVQAHPLASGQGSQGPVESRRDVTQRVLHAGNVVISCMHAKQPARDAIGRSCLSASAASGHEVEDERAAVMAHRRNNAVAIGIARPRGTCAGRSVPRSSWPKVASGAILSRCFPPEPQPVSERRMPSGDRASWATLHGGVSASEITERLNVALAHRYRLERVPAGGGSRRGSLHVIGVTPARRRFSDSRRVAASAADTDASE